MRSLLQLLIVTVTWKSYGSATTSTNRQKPNILIILADDLGINDVSFHGSNQILTPNIDALAYNGVILNQLYTPNLCTPSRASLMTGKFPIYTGTQHSVIYNDEPWGLPLSEHIMPEIFHDAGYSTNLIGKWHLGFSEKAYTPTLRGFDYHVGYLAGYLTYYDHDLHMIRRNYSKGYDLRRNLEVNYEGKGKYATDYFTDEAVQVVQRHNKTNPLFLLMAHLAVHAGSEDKSLEAPIEEVSKFTHISDLKRRTYAAMVSKLDESVGKIMRALSNKKMLDNTIVLFFSDNGAPTVGGLFNTGSNYPFKGQKNSGWEGGIRSPGVIWSPLIKKPRVVSQQKMHVIDMLPTLLSAAGIKIPLHHQLDGIDLWDTLSKNATMQSRNFIHVLDDVLGYSSYMRDNWKYVNGTAPFPHTATWLGDIEDVADPRVNQYNKLILGSQVSQAIKQSKLTAIDIRTMRRQATYRCNILPGISPNEGTYKCNPSVAPCLFNIKDDPCEMYNIAGKFPALVQKLEADVKYYRSTAIKPRNRDSDPRCNPGFYNNTWTFWREAAEGL